MVWRLRTKEMSFWMEIPPMMGWFYVTSSLDPSLWANKNMTFKGKADTLLFIFGKHACTISTFPFNRILNSTHNQWISSIFALFHHWSYPPTRDHPPKKHRRPQAVAKPGLCVLIFLPGPQGFQLIWRIWLWLSFFLASLEGLRYWFAANMIMIKIVGILADVWAKTINQYTLW